MAPHMLNAKSVASEARFSTSSSDELNHAVLTSFIYTGMLVNFKWLNSVHRFNNIQASFV